MSLGKDAKDIKAGEGSSHMLGFGLRACKGPDETETPRVHDHTPAEKKRRESSTKIGRTGTVYSFQIHTPGTKINESKLEGEFGVDAYISPPAIRNPYMHVFGKENILKFDTHMFMILRIFFSLIQIRCMHISNIFSFCFYLYLLI